MIQTYNFNIIDSLYNAAYDHLQRWLSHPQNSHTVASAQEATIMTTLQHVPIRAAAERLGVHENTIRNWIDRGILRAVRLPSGIRRISLGEVDRMEAEIFGAPTSFREMHVTRAPKPLPESALIRTESYPSI